jgi:hypothetical protein
MSRVVRAQTRAPSTRYSPWRKTQCRTSASVGHRAFTISPAPGQRLQGGLARHLEAVCRLLAALKGNPSPRPAMVSERAEQCDPSYDVFVRNYFVQRRISRRL